MTVLMSSSRKWEYKCIKQLLPIGLKRTFRFGTDNVQIKKVDIYTVKELLGHKTIVMTMRYAHHYPESLRKAFERLEIINQSATILLPLHG